MSVVAVLQRFAAPRRPAAERCGLCGAPIAERHPHVADLRARRLECACAACAVLFRSSASGTWRTVPGRVRHDPALALEAGALAALGIPVRLAFVLERTGVGPVCLYPGPAGTVEGTPDPARWAALAERSPLLRAAAPEVEAILFAAAPGAPLADVFLVGIDRCYALAGLLRRTWRGFDGGAEARRGIAAFLDELRAESRPLGEAER